MRSIAILLVLLCAALLFAVWFGYPTWLRIRSRGHVLPRRTVAHKWWPSLTIVVVVRNAEGTIRQMLDNLLALSYPGDRRRILVVSDASTDFTDAIAKTYHHRGVDLLRILKPKGAVRAANYARRHVRDDLVVLMEPDARMSTGTLAALVAPFVDQSVGVTYARELAIDAMGARRVKRETPYLAYECMLRERESRIWGTVSARRTLYAMRGPLFTAPTPAWVNPDFMLILSAAEHGYRAMHVTQARCVLTRPKSMRREYSRTVTAVARDVLTLLRRPHMMNPRKYGDFAWMLLGHKVGRWLTPWALGAGFVGLLMLAPSAVWARFAAGAFLLFGLGAAALSLIPSRTRLLRAAALPGHVATTTVAIAHASLKAIKARTALRRGLEPALG